MWIAERHGLSDSILFSNKSVVTFYYEGTAIGGDDFEYKGEKMKVLYVIDFSKTPNWIDFNIRSLKSNKLIEHTKGIIQFLSDDSMMLRTPFDKNAERPSMFDYDNKIGETMIYKRK